MTLVTSGEELAGRAETSVALWAENFPSSPRAEIRRQLVVSVVDEVQGAQSKKSKDAKFQECRSTVRIHVAIKDGFDLQHQIKPGLMI